MFLLQTTNTKYEEIFENYLEKASANNLLNLAPEKTQSILKGEYLDNLIILEFAIHAEILTELYTELKNFKKQLNPEKAVGKELDKLLEPFITRIPAKNAHTELKLNWQTPLKEDLILTSEILITSSKNPEIIFTNIHPIILPKDETSTTFTAYNINTGPEGNINPNTLDTIEIPDKKYPKITLIQEKPAYGGTTSEDDRLYRIRAGTWRFSNIQGTYDSVKTALDNITKLEKYKIEPCWDGPGTTRILIKPYNIKKEVKEVLWSIKALDEEYTIQKLEGDSGK